MGVGCVVAGGRAAFNRHVCRRTLHYENLVDDDDEEDDDEEGEEDDEVDDLDSFVPVDTKDPGWGGRRSRHPSVLRYGVSCDVLGTLTSARSAPHVLKEPKVVDTAFKPRLPLSRPRDLVVQCFERCVSTR